MYLCMCVCACVCVLVCVCLCVLNYFSPLFATATFNTMDHGKKVWAPDLKDGFVLGEIQDFGTDTLFVQPLSGAKVIEAPYDAVYPSEDEDAKAVEDNCKFFSFCVFFFLCCVCVFTVC